MRSRFKNLLILTLPSLLLSFLMMELCLYLLTENGYLRIAKPGYTLSNALSGFWVDINPNFGVWHQPYSKYRHAKSCFDVTYQANSYGARDIERQTESKKNRVILLGDSFIEGFGVQREKRLSNLLEKDSGIEHLNFGTAGNFGTTQYYLMYKTLAKQFEHQAVVIGLLPDNDFEDDDYEFGRKFYHNRYRPYFIGSYPNYRLIYYQETLQPFDLIRTINGILREFTYTYNTLSFVKGQILYRKAQQSKTIYSGYYDFTEKQFNLMKYAISKIVEEAEGKTVSIFTIPVLDDLQRYDKFPEAPPPLSQQLDVFSTEIGIKYIDLLTDMYQHTEHWEQYYLPCDSHWSEYGNWVASQYLMAQLPTESDD